jgi:hypothetical protein
MPQLPRFVWLIVVGVALLLVGLCGIAAYAVLRARTRQRVALWPATWILAVAIVAVVPWLVVWLVPIRISVNIEGVVPLIGWLIVALAAFALLVLLPWVALLSAGVWLIARRRPR